MRKIFVLSFLLSLSTFSFGGFFYRDIEFVAMEDFEVERTDDALLVKFNYVINNPNWYGIIIKPSSMFLTIAGKECGWVRISDKIKLKRKTQAKYPFALKGNPGDFVKSAFSSLFYAISGKAIDFNMKGKLKAGVAMFKFNWNIDYTYELTLDEFMSFF